ncbi:MAG: type II secretion system F family protein [Planctomycetales bacterium]
MFFRRIPLKTLAVLCKSLATMLHAGVPLLKALDIVSKKTGDARCRANVREVRESVQHGVDIAQALRDRSGWFPELAIDMIHVGEETGCLPEVLDGLADHYENILRLRRTFLTMIAWPAIQLFAAILIIGGLIWLLGFIAGSQGGPGAKPLDLLGWGLTGTKGALLWFALSFGTVFGIVGGYFLIARVFRQQRALDRLLLRIPVVGHCLQSFAIARFSWAFALTQQTGMPIDRSLETSFQATGNGAFAGAAPEVRDLVMAGEELGTALGAIRLFPDDFLQMVQVGESSGMVPETLQRLSPQFEDQARRSLRALAAMLGWLVWIVVAGFIIFVILSIVMKYVGMINNAAQGNFDW